MKTEHKDAIERLVNLFRSSMEHRVLVDLSRLSEDDRRQIDALAALLDGGKLGVAWPRERVFGVVVSMGLNAAIWYAAIIANSHVIDILDESRSPIEDSDVEDFLAALVSGDYGQALAATARLRARSPLDDSGPISK